MGIFYGQFYKFNTKKPFISITKGKIQITKKEQIKLSSQKIQFWYKLEII